MNNSHNIKDPIKNNEDLYRRIKNKGDQIEYRQDSKGNLEEVYPDAFHDGNKQPSLIRVKFVNPKSLNSVKNKIEGLINIRAKDIRSIGDVVSCVNDQEISHTVNVIYSPTGNSIIKITHSLIIVEPDFFGTKNERKMAFLKLKEALAMIATMNGWLLKPDI